MFVPETNINFLMSVALDKVVYLAFAYVVEQWRWRVFSEGVEAMNERWWRLRWLHHGISPPVPRTEEHLDAAAKYHVAADAPYLRYFVALILQFQIHEALCQAAGHKGPLHTCDIYRSKEAGLLLRDVMSLGASFSWRNAVRVATKGAAHKLDARPLMEYFNPLALWLGVQNSKNGTVGWSDPEDPGASRQHSAGGACNTRLSLMHLSLAFLVSTMHWVRKIPTDGGQNFRDTFCEMGDSGRSGRRVRSEKTTNLISSRLKFRMRALRTAIPCRTVFADIRLDIRKITDIRVESYV